MKVIKCELCGSNELLKGEDFFVCQHCGTKYTTEAARKLIVEISQSVTVNGTVETMVGTAEKNRLIKKVETLFELNQVKELDVAIKKYCEEYPDDWWGWFWAFKQVLHGRFWHYKPGTGTDIGTKHYDGYPHIAERHIKNGIQVCPKSEIELLERNYNECYIELIKRIDSGEFLLTCSQIIQFNQLVYAFPNLQWKRCLSKYLSKYEANAFTIRKATTKYYTKENLKIVKEYSLNEGGYITFAGRMLKDMTYYDGVSIMSTVGNSSIRCTIGEYDYYGYLSVENFILELKRQNTKGCYIATCVYGSYDCPQVWTLRRFRDNILNTTWYGRIFIKCYYAISPTLVKWFGEQNWFRIFWKNRLDKMVNKLNERGVEDTQYNDRY